MTATAPVIDQLRAELMRRELARRHLIDFCRYTKPVRTDESGTIFDHGYRSSWHHEVIADALDRVVAGTCKRLMIFVPPRHGKSELASVRFPPFLLGRVPTSRIIAASYGADLAHEMSRQAQRIMDSEEYAKIFPRTALNLKNIRTVSGAPLRNVDEWEVVDPIRAMRWGGRYKCAGVGGALTGRGFDVGIIDDPVKDRMEADSAVYRERVWNWYTGVFYTRRSGPNARIIIIQTRWHDDDLSGRLLRADAAHEGDDWEVLELPAVAKSGKRAAGDNRKEGAALWPELFDEKALLKTAKQIGSRDWQALYQQNPMLDGGNVFKREWFREYRLDRSTLPESVRGGWCVSERAPISETPGVAAQLGRVDVVRIDAAALMRFITVDPALTEKESADYSVVDVWGFDSERGDLYLLDHWRDQVSSPDLLDKIGDQLNAWRCVRVYVESVAFQKSLIQFADRLDWPVTELVADRDKLARAYAAAPLVEQGRVYVPTSAEWWPTLQHELLTFPQSDRKDQVDSFAYGCLVIREGLGSIGIGPTAGDHGPSGGRLNPHRYGSRWQAGGGRRWAGGR